MLASICTVTNDEQHVHFIACYMSVVLISKLQNQGNCDVLASVSGSPGSSMINCRATGKR